jgi:hypothetical protein
MVNATTADPVLSFFVFGGSQMQDRMPLGRYVMKYAVGKSWCNERDLFGPDTNTRQADEIFTFERHARRDEYGVTTSTTNITVELILQKGGNLRTHHIPRSDF